MRNTIVLMISLLFLAQGGVKAQKAISAGIKAYESGSYEQAIASLDEGLAEADKMKDKALAEAYHFRAAAKVTYLNKLKSWENLPEEMDKTVYDYGLTAAQDVAKALKHDKDKKWARELKTLKAKTEVILVGMSRIDLLEAEKSGAAEADIKFHLERVIPMGDAGIALDKFNYVNYNLKADAQLGLGQKADALQNYKSAASYFFRSAPKTGDLKIAYTYMHIAELEKELNNDLTAAKEAIKTGREKLEGENKKIQELGNRRPAEKAAFADYYEEIKEEMNKVAAKL